MKTEGHTHFPLSYLLRYDSKDREYFSHDLYDDVPHSRGRPNLDIFFKTQEKVFHAVKQGYKSALASANILDGLGDVLLRTPI